MSIRKGCLVVIEGINGAGKSSIIEALADHYRRVQIDISVYKFPNRHGSNGNKIDRYLKGELVISSKYDVLDMFASDRRSVECSIKQDIADGKIVICDRYVFSAIAYHKPHHVDDIHVIRNYCNVIGYFDQTMPIPDIVYLIEGDHLSKRGIVQKEVFHYNGKRSNKMHILLKDVISNYTKQFRLVRNKNQKLSEVVNFIINDIDLTL